MIKTINKGDSIAAGKLLGLMGQDDLTLTNANQTSTNGQTVTTGMLSLFNHSELTAVITEYSGYIQLQITTAEGSIVSLVDFGDLLNLNSAYSDLYPTLKFSTIKIYAGASNTDNVYESLTIEGIADATTTFDKSFLGIDLPLSELALSIGIRFKNGSTEKDIGVWVLAKLTINGQEVQAVLDLPTATQGLWGLRLIAPGLGFSLTSLLKLVMGSKAFDELPDQVKSIPSFDLVSLEINFDPHKKQLNDIRFNLRSAGEWELIPGYTGSSVLTLKEIGLSLAIFRSDAVNFAYFGEIIANAYIKDFEIIASIPLPVTTGNLSFCTNTTTTLDDFGVFSDLLDGVGFSDLLPPRAFKDSFTLYIHTLGLEINLGNQSSNQSGLSSFSLDGEAFLNLVITTEFSLRLDSNLRIEYSKLTGTGQLQVIIDAQAILLFAGISLTLTGNYDTTEKGWLLSGSTAAGQSIAIGSLMADLVTKFNITSSSPDSISRLTINNFSVSLNTNTKDFNFTLETKFPTEGQELDMVLNIDIKRQQDNSYTKHFSGKITVDKLEFDVIFDTKPNATTFIAAYTDPDGHSQNIGELVKLVYTSYPSALDSLTFTLKDALLAYQSEAGAPASSQWLFGLDIDGGLNLSDLRLPDLPLVGPVFPPDQTLQLAFQVLVASSKFEKDDVSKLTALLPPGSINLPAQDINDLTLNATLRMGGQTLQLPLNLGVNPTPVDATSPALVTSGTTPPTGIAQPGSPPVPTPAPTLDAAPNDGTQWVKIQKTFGPVHVEQVGVKYDGQITVALNASLAVGGLTIALQGLKATSPIDKLSPTFSLDGLGIEYQNGVVELAGSFLKMVDPLTNTTQFAGLAILRAQALSLSAIGAYGKTPSGDVSLFIYATLNYPLGGPSFFFVTGLAAGFGYNRALVPPTIDQVASFPLVAQAVSGPPPMPAPGAEQTALASALSSLQQYVPIDVGQMFFAVGIKFTSFKMIESFALLIVQFGNRTEIDLLGLSTLIVPTPKDGDTTPSLAEAQLALKATFIPDEGFLSVEAQLTSASYIIDRSCHLTGGFAFYSWFSGEHAGDFVLTLGGYHPNFNAPKHYPKNVPRLGIKWQVNDHLSITGQEYYALTAHALMAGGSLSADYHNGSVHAWFNAGADFLLTWQPYHYEASLHISLGAEVTIHFFGTHNLSFDAGADLDLWGPPFGGHADIHLKVCGFKVLFDIDFGSGHAGASPIGWDDFKKAFLPAATQVCSLSVQSGLLRQITEGSDERWIVNPQSFVLATNSVIPAKSAAADGSISGEGAISVQPMGITADQLTSTHTITITRDGPDGKLVPAEADFVYQPVLKQVPAGMWGMPVMDGRFLAKPDVNAASFVENALCGLAISPKPPTSSPETHSIERGNLQFETFIYGQTPAYPQPIWENSNGQTYNQAAWTDIQNSVIANSKRDTLLQELGLATSVIDFGQPVDQFTLSAPQTAAGLA